MNPISRRIAGHAAVTAELASLSNQSLSEVLAKGKPLGAGIGGAAVMFEVSGIPVFAKRVLLTDLERLPENAMSTANLFDLPPYLHYGIGAIGSPGFGAWRELSAHLMSTEWVLTGECPNFPLLYHWRVLPESAPPQPHEEHRDLNRVVEYWEGSTVGRRRLEANLVASASIVLFLEHIPMTLWSWLGHKISEGGEIARAAVAMVDRELESTTSFMQSRDFIHFDAHFRNILTDGSRLYFTDFGLAACHQFELSSAESAFFDVHREYDRHYTATCFVNRIVSELFGTENCDAVLREYIEGRGRRRVEPWAEELIARYAPVAVTMKDFMRKFQTEARTVSYPADELNERMRYTK